MERRARSLAEVTEEQTVAVRRILFDGLRVRCGDLGLHEGDRLSLARREGEALLVSTGDGRWVRCPAQVARFVEVEPATN